MNAMYKKKGSCVYFLSEYASHQIKIIAKTILPENAICTDYISAWERYIFPPGRRVLL